MSDEAGARVPRGREVFESTEVLYRLVEGSETETVDPFESALVWLIELYSVTWESEAEAIGITTDEAIDLLNETAAVVREIGRLL